LKKKTKRIGSWVVTKTAHSGGRGANSVRGSKKGMPSTGNVEKNVGVPKGRPGNWEGEGRVKLPTTAECMKKSIFNCRLGSSQGGNFDQKSLWLGNRVNSYVKEGEE